MREKLKRIPLTRCVDLLLIGNICFIAFIVICLIYYYLFGESGIFVLGFEVAAYAAEAIGFLLCLVGTLGLTLRMEGHRPVKILMFVYLAAEILLMLLDFGYLSLSFFDGQSDTLIIGHAIFSAGIVMSYMSIEQERGRFQIVVMLAACFMLGGMFSAPLNFRIYGSILVNAFAYIYLYARMRSLLGHEDMKIRCNDDPVKPQTFQSTFFDE